MLGGIREGAERGLGEEGEEEKCLWKGRGRGGPTVRWLQLDPGWRQGLDEGRAEIPRARPQVENGAMAASYCEESADPRDAVSV